MTSRSYLKNASNAQGLCCPANIGGAEHFNLLIIRREVPPGGAHRKNISLLERKHNIMNSGCPERTIGIECGSGFHRGFI
jgi:hypothetical protein